MLTPAARAGRTLAEWTDAERSSQLFDAVVREVTVVAAGGRPRPARRARRR
jgi:hypothetical protein